MKLLNQIYNQDFEEAEKIYDRLKLWKGTFFNAEVFTLCLIYVRLVKNGQKIMKDRYVEKPCLN